MTNDQKNNLVKLFCENSLDDLAENKYKKILEIMNVYNPQELISVEGYGKFFKSINDIAEEVNTIQKEPLETMQVKIAIKFLKQKYNEANEEIITAAKRIFEERLFPNWNKISLSHFKTLDQLITQWSHFFISYTNSSTPAVNNTFKKLLSDELDPLIIKKNKNRVNLVAAVLYKYFKMNRLQVFYDKENIDWSDNFKNQIFSHCQKSFAFVQFIETEIFQQASDSNYCYREYNSYYEAISLFAKENKMQDFQPLYFFIVSNPQNEKHYDFMPAGLEEPKLKNWGDNIKEKQFVTLHQGIRSPELRLQIQKAAAKMVAIKEKLLDDYLNTF